MNATRALLLALGCCLWGARWVGAQEDPEGGDHPGIQAADDAHTLFVFEFESADPARDDRLREMMARLDDKLRRRLRQRPLERVRVVVLADASTFHERLKRDGIGDVPEHTAGLALPRHDLCYINREALVADREGDFERVMGHEVAHLYLGRLDPGDRLPLWFHEGVAEWASRGARGGRFENLRLAATLDALDDLDDLAQSFPEERHRRALAYEHSEAFVSFLDDLAIQGLAALLSALEDGQDLDSACERVLGRPLAVLESDWRRTLTEQGPSPWLPFLDHLWWSLLVLVMTALLGVGLWRQQRRNRMIAQHWEAEGFGAMDDEDRDREHPWARPVDEADDPPYHSGEDEED